VTIGKSPTLRDEARDHTVPESCVIIEYLTQHHPGWRQFLLTDAEPARERPPP
jgi:glutathione S-transferase